MAKIAVIVYVMCHHGNDVIVNLLCEKFTIGEEIGEMIFTIVLSILVTVLICLINIEISMIKQIMVKQKKEECFSNIIHDFRSPITTINLGCQVLREDGERREAGREDYVMLINEEAERLNIMTEQIMNMIRTKDMVFYEKIIDIHEVIKKANETMSFIVKRNNGEVFEELNASNHLVKADESCIRSVFLNIIDNAVKYCESNPLIIISTSNVGNKLKIEIRDNGIGISADDIKNIFRKAYRVKSEKTRNLSGFGFGLYHAKRIIEKLSGNIFVDSQLGRGTIFVITLPYYKPP